nr:MAG TPA: hypothetical protein [Caudoviricetes sp.]
MQVSLMLLLMYIGDTFPFIKRAPLTEATASWKF